jgi:hypothetical protein
MHTLRNLHEVAGQCACGAVRFECQVEDEVALCSCDLCRRSSGSAFQAWVNGQRKSLQVEGDTSSWKSSTHALRLFCAACGSPLFLFEQDEPDVVEIAAGALSTPDGISGCRRTYAEKMPCWGKL